MRRLRWRQRSEHRRGVAAAEFAMLLPLLVLVVLGAVDFGRFGYTYIAVQNAARAGAAYGIMHPFATATRPAWDAAIRSAVEQELAELAVPGGFDSSKLVVTTNAAMQSGGKWTIRVQVQYPFDSIVGWPKLPRSTLLSGAVEMRSMW